MAVAIELVFEDEDLIIVNKPAGLLSIPDRYNPNILNVYHTLLNQYEKVWIVHRLDRDTSGIMCFAKNEEAHVNLSRQFDKHTVVKTYHAIVEGRMTSETGTIDLPIGEHPGKRGTMRVDRQYGKPSVSCYRVLEAFKAYTYLEVEIETGRMHQIRVHLKAIKHPLAVDELYGTKTEFLLSSIKSRYNLKKTEEQEQPLLARVPLHAYALTLDHPRTGERLTYTADLPKDMRAMLNQLRKWNKLITNG